MSRFAKMVPVVGCLVIGVWSLVGRADSPSDGDAKTQAATAPVTEKRTDDSPNESAIRRALAEKTSVKWEDVQLGDAIAELARKHRIQVLLDTQKLQDEGVATDTPINLQLSDITLRSLLHLMLENLQLAAIVQDEILLVTTQAAAGERLTTEVYDVRRLVKDENFQPLIDVLTQTVQPDQWDAVGGPGTYSQIPNGLVLRQTESVHREIRELLADVERVYTAPVGKVPPPAVNENEAAIRRKLETRTSFNCVDAPLASVLQSLSLLHGIQIILDTQKLQDEGIATDTPIHINIQNARLDSILNTFLRDLQMTWIIEDEVLKVTTTVDAGERLYTKVYDVRDLKWKANPAQAQPGFYQITTLAQGFGGGASSAGGGLGGAGTGRGSDHPMGGAIGIAVDDFLSSPYQWLNDVITQTVQPDQWDSVGGPGSVSEFHGLFIIRQTQAVHDEVSRLIPRVRELALAKPAEQPAGEKKPDDPQPLVVYQVDGYPAADLAKILPEVIEPSSWIAGGGKGTIHAVQGAILVRQTPSVHREIGKLLQQLGLHGGMGGGMGGGGGGMGSGMMRLSIEFGKAK